MAHTDFYEADGYLYHSGPNPANLTEAFDISIRKWKYLEQNPIYDRGPFTCGLCMMFLTRDTEIDCEGCPISEDGHRYCDETPYQTYHDAHESLSINGGKEYLKLMKSAAKEEVKYLRSLRKKLGV